MAVKNRREGTFVNRVNEIIESNFKDERFGVSALAGKMNMSRTTLHRKIRSATGTSVSRFLRNTRLNKALEFLVENSITVAEAAYMSGFGSADYFSKCFRNYFGYPPVEAKKRIFDASDPENQKKSGVSKESRNLLKNFPGQTTSFIGRDKEIGTIISLIEKHRIVTLTGTGGCGKTRLACEVAAQLVKFFPDDIWFVDLAPIEVEELVIKQLMTTLGLSEAPGRDMMDIVVEGIKDRKLLILLDNCEHLIRTCAAISHKLIGSVPGLSLLVTSREALHINGEKIWFVPSLTLPDPEADIDINVAGKSEAVCLFTDRARLNNSEFELVEKNASTVSTICHRVDGIPLAIELVACRTRYMDTFTILNRLSERFDTLPSLDQSSVDRHKTIQAAIAWSYNLLTDKGKALFRQLSVFSGGFDLDAAEEVCANEILPKEIIPDLLSQLVDKSMIQTVYLPGQTMRYKLLETLQRFASNLLVETEEAVWARKRHLEYFTGIAEQAYQEQFESQFVWLTKLKQENYNLNSALNWADQNCPEEFSILTGYLSWFWVLVPNFLSGKQYLEKALSNGPKGTEAYARNLCGLGYLAFYFRDRDYVFDLLNKSLSLWNRLKNRFEEAIVLNHLSASHQSISKDMEEAIKHSERCLELARKLDKPGLLNNALGYLCISLVHSKQFDNALPYLDELLTSSISLNQPFWISGARHLRSDCALGVKDFREAEKRYGLGVNAALKYGILFNAYADLQGIAFALSGQTRWAKSIRLNAVAIEMFKSIGVEIYGIWPLWDEFKDTYIDGARKAVGEELAKQYGEEGIAMGFERAVKYALDFNKD